MSSTTCGYVPEYCVWELTLRCNMRCLHCGSVAGRARDNELAVDECLPVADALVALGNRYTSLIGGEVFLYHGWEHIARRLADAGVIVNIISNGLHLGDREVAQIRAANLYNVCFSLDGMREHHDQIRQVKGSFDKVIAACDRLRAENIPVAIVTTLLSLNIGDLEEMDELLRAHGVIGWQLQIATPMGNLAGARDLLLDPAEVPRITRFIRDHRDGELWILAADDIGYYDDNELHLRNMPGHLCAWNGCHAGLRAIGIDSIGNVKGCESLYDPRFIEGNVRTEPLAVIWNKEGNFAYNRQFDVSQLAGRCAGCDRGSRCRGGCRGACYFNAEGMYENPYCCYPARPPAPPLATHPPSHALPVLAAN